MTLPEALRALHAAGRIRAPYLPGMVVGAHYGGVARGSCRIVRVLPHDGTHLIEVVAGGEAFPSDGLFRFRADRAEITGVLTDDPATVGCLLALYREAGLDNTALVEPDALLWPAHYEGPWKAGRWVEDGIVWGPSARSEGEALAGALVALAAVVVRRVS